ncbi:unnamed protein product [Boreogadus saida]
MSLGGTESVRECPPRARARLELVREKLDGSGSLRTLQRRSCVSMAAGGFRVCREGVRLYGRTGEGVRLYGRTGEGVWLYGRTGEGVRLYGRTGEGVRLYGRTGEGVRLYGRTGPQGQRCLKQHQGPANNKSCRFGKRASLWWRLVGAVTDRCHVHTRSVCATTPTNRGGQAVRGDCSGGTPQPTARGGVVLSGLSPGWRIHRAGPRVFSPPAGEMGSAQTIMCIKIREERVSIEAVRFVYCLEILHGV